MLDLQEVPANQNNTKGAECDPNTFVEHCRGSNMVLCKYDDVKKKGKVTLDECNTGDTCNLTLIDGKNYPGCIGESWACQQGDSGEKACDTDDLGYELLRVYSCVLFDDGNYYQVYTETYCAGACSTKKCEPESCDPLVSKCSDDLQYTLECNEIAPGKYIYKASNCKDFDASCTTYLDPKTDKTWAYCGGDPI